MSHTYDELQGKTVAQLREVAREVEHDALAGYTTMHKDELLAGLCSALGIQAVVHHEVVGLDKAPVKARIRELKAQRAQALEARDKRQLRKVRTQIKRLKRRLRRATV